MHLRQIRHHQSQTNVDSLYKPITAKSFKTQLMGPAIVSFKIFFNVRFISFRV